MDLNLKCGEKLRIESGIRRLPVDLKRLKPVKVVGSG